MTSRCTGHCCLTFTLPFSPEQLQDAYERWQRQGTAEINKAGLKSVDTKIWQDIWLIAPMVTYLGFFKKPPVKVVNPTDNELLGKPGKGGHYYSCKHFDRKKKVCTIYEIRPSLCRRYPYGRGCNYAGCTWKSHKAKKETKTGRAKRLKRLKGENLVKVNPGGGKLKPPKS